MDPEEGNGVEQPQPRQLPSDLPRSLNDRRHVPSYGGETEMYDGWQGKLWPAQPGSIQSELFG